MKKIKLTKGQYALVDDEDFERVNQFKWHADWSKTTKSFKAAGKIKKNNGKQGWATLQMSRYIMDCPMDMQVDHEKHNTLDNRKSNLRICTRQQNNFNQKIGRCFSSKYKGVSWNKNAKKWLASIRFNQKGIYLGVFKSEINAAKAYNKKAKELFGEFALLNKI